jgi:hypothetical protein
MKTKDGFGGIYNSGDPGKSWDVILTNDRGLTHFLLERKNPEARKTKRHVPMKLFHSYCKDR